MAGERAVRRYHVYVVELDSAVLQEKRFRERNPQHRPGLPCVYVGMTGLAVEQRFENHRRGYKCSRYVHRYGRRLLPELFAHLGPVSFEEAGRKETAFAEDLRQRGLAVTDWRRRTHA